MAVPAPPPYIGHELDAMAEAENYYRWILARCRHHLGRSVLEHGAGIGTFSRFLLAEAIDRLVVLEPSVVLVPTLRARLGTWADRIEIVPSTLEAWASIPGRSPVDTIISVNVLEHIEDDGRTLTTMRAVLPAGGRLVLFVPALPRLYGTLDHAFGHVRRYRRRDLVDKVTAAGFRVMQTRFMNAAGVVSWFLAGRLLRRRGLARGAVKAYDRYAIPLVAGLERLWTPPIGQNLLLLAVTS